MRIGIDGRMVLDKTTGIGQYTFNILKELAQIDKKNQYIIFSDDRLKEFVSDKDNFILEKTGTKVFSVSEQVVLPFLISKNKIDVFHTPSFAAPVFLPCSSIMTIHDLIHLNFPDLFSRKVRIYYEEVVKRAALRMKKIIAVSESSKKDIIKWLNLDPDKIVVIYNGVSRIYHPTEDENTLNSVKNKFGISKRFILFVGNRKPHKNILRLIEAFKILKNKVDCSLLIITDNDSRFTEPEEKVLELDLSNDVIISGPVENEELPLLYSAADVFILPSLCEGFGLPALEAMSCGTPVVASETSSLPEVIGSAGILIDPYDVNSIADALEKILEDDVLRKEMIKRGYSQAAKFNWRDTAGKTLEVYENV
ncbi:MAG: glycosyltransferase family 4 protein [Actinobacteria bacterium]|nr:glycosyltransferase family 4 protein [Actinomycetota bacterium]